MEDIVPREWSERHILELIRKHGGGRGTPCDIVPQLIGSHLTLPKIFRQEPGRTKIAISQDISIRDAACESGAVRIDLRFLVKIGDPWPTDFSAGEPIFITWMDSHGWGELVAALYAVDLRFPQITDNEFAYAPFLYPPNTNHNLDVFDMEYHVPHSTPETPWETVEIQQLDRSESTPSSASISSYTGDIKWSSPMAEYGASEAIYTDALRYDFRINGDLR